MQDYPEHEKLKAIRHFSEKIKEFLDWLREEKNIQFDWQPTDPESGFFRCPTDLELLSEFFKIDQKVLEQEKQQMIELQRQLNKEEEQIKAGTHARCRICKKCVPADNTQPVPASEFATDPQTLAILDDCPDRICCLSCVPRILEDTE